MPNQTFFNLPAEKREQITQVAIDEFAGNDYDGVSISRMVARAGIAKGSFYQYFTGKEDLYAYLLGLLVDAKMRFLSGYAPDPQHTGIFAYLRWAMRTSVELQLAYPKLSRIGLRAINAHTFPTAFEEKMRDESQAFYRRLIEVGIERGDIVPDLDHELAAVVFDAVMTSVGWHMMQRIGPGIAAAADGTMPLDSPEITKLMTQALEVLECGMGTRRRGGDE